MTCIRLESKRQPDQLDVALGSQPTWRIDRKLDCGREDGPDHKRLPLAPDSALLPIRPEPDQCEVDHEESVSRTGPGIYT